MNNESNDRYLICLFNTFLIIDANKYIAKNCPNSDRGMYQYFRKMILEEKLAEELLNTLDIEIKNALNGNHD